MNIKETITLVMKSTELKWEENKWNLFLLFSGLTGMCLFLLSNLLIKESFCRNFLTAIAIASASTSLLTRKMKAVSLSSMGHRALVLLAPLEFFGVCYCLFSSLKFALKVLS
jgi:hypothetical protein